MSEIPSLEHFIKYFYNEDYFKALNLKSNASLEQITDAIESFEMEHFEFSEKFSIPMAKVKAILLNQNTESAGEISENPKKEVSFEDKIVSHSLYQQALEYFYKNDLERALDLLAQALDWNPVFVHAYSLRASILLIMPDYPSYLEQVILDCSKVIELESGDANAYNDRGRAYMRKGNPERAIQDYAMALNIEPSMSIAALNKMSAEITLMRFDDAVGTYGALKKDDLSHRDDIVSASLVSIALALDGKTYEQYMESLKDPERKIKYLVDWNPSAIDDYLEQLSCQGYDLERLSRALDIQKMFKKSLRS